MPTEVKYIGSLNIIHKLLRCAQGRIQDLRRGFIHRGSGDTSPPAGSRGKAPCRGLGTKPPEAEEVQNFEMLICLTILTHNIKIDG